MNTTVKMCELLNHLGYHITYEELQKDDIDLGDFIVDSLEFVTLIVEIENTFLIELPDEFLDFDILASLRGMISAVEALVCQNTEKKGKDTYNEAAKED